MRNPACRVGKVHLRDSKRSRKRARRAHSCNDLSLRAWPTSIWLLLGCISVPFYFLFVFVFLPQSAERPPFVCEVTSAPPCFGREPQPGSRRGHRHLHHYRRRRSNNRPRAARQARPRRKRRMQHRWSRVKSAPWVARCHALRPPGRPRLPSLMPLVNPART